MTSQQYIEQVLENVIAPEQRKREFAADLASHFEPENRESGESDADIISRLGPPEDVAASLMAEFQFTASGFWARCFAFAGDLGLCLLPLIPFFVLCVLLQDIITSSQVMEVLFAAFVLLSGLALLGLLVLYFPVLEHLHGKTLFKHVMGIRVVTEAGGRISLGTAFIRRLSFYFELLWLDALFVPFTEKKQRAFDLVAKTIVIDEPDSNRGLGNWLFCLAPWLCLAICAIVLALIAER